MKSDGIVSDSVDINKIGERELLTGHYFYTQSLGREVVCAGGGLGWCWVLPAANI